MILSTDSYKKLEQSKVFLANPQKNYIGELSGVKNLHVKLNLNSMSKASFIIYRTENNEVNAYYDKIDYKRLIEIQYIGWFQIAKIEDRDDGANPFKNVSCVSLENQLASKRIKNISGTYTLYDILDPEHSLLHIISAATGWNISHVDNELLGKYRTFNTDKAFAYSFLMSDISKAYSCVFQFNTFTNSISAYKLENIGRLTDLVISRNNILQEFIKEASSDKIVTKLVVSGAEGVDITDINPSGANYLIDLSYFKSSQWMSQELINSLDAYQVKYNSYKSSYQTTLASLKAKKAELAALNTELTALQTSLKDASDTQGEIISDLNRVPIPSDDKYSEYQTTISNIATYTNQVNTKNTAITNKTNEVNSVQASLDVITNALSMANNFTSAQLLELGSFLTEDAEYQDSSFQITDDMTAEDILTMKEELLVNGYNELNLACKPQYQYKTTASNLFSICDNKDDFISNDKSREDCQLGNMITIKVRDNYYVTVRLLSIDFDFNKLDDIDLTFSDQIRSADSQSKFDEILAMAQKTSNSYSFSKFGYDKAASITNDVQEFMTSTFKATTNALVNSDNVTTEFGKFGIRNKEWLPDQNKYSDYQSWWTNNTLLFTDSNWSDSKAGIGVFTDTTGAKTMAVMADVICGRLIMSQRLNISNSSGTYTITDETGFRASKDGYSVTINPNTPSEIFKIEVNGSNSMYIDTVNKKLVMNGVINASSGTLGSLNVTGTLYGGTIQGTTINGANINGAYINGGTFYSKNPNNAQSTTIEGGTITTNSFVSDTGTGNNFNITGNYLQMWHPSLQETFHLDGLGNMMCKTLNINGSTPLTNTNYTSYMSQYLTQDSFLIQLMQSAIGDLQSRVSALEK